MDRPIRLLILLLLPLLLTACSKSQLTSSWVDPGFRGPVQGKILVIGAFDESIAHNIYEDSFVADLRQAGVDAVAGHHYGLSPEEASKQALDGALQQSGASAILMTHLVNEKIKRDVLQPDVAGQSYFTSWSNVYGYHRLVIDYVRAEGAVEKKTTDLMEVALFDASTGKRIWAAGSKSVNLNNMLQKDDQQLEDLFIKDMREYNVL
jgi:hypothetical protein